VETGEAPGKISSGLILLAACKTLHQCSSVEPEEALASLEGVRLALEWIHMPVILESDNSEVVASLKTKKASRSTWEGMIVEVKAAMQVLQ
jgi:RNA polymerase subunit RPABC4/transcription elongation factor Spt4